MDNSSYPAMPPPTSAPPPADRAWAAITSLVLGVINLCAWFFPICGGPVAIAGIVFGILGLSSSRRGLAIAGLVLGVIGLCLSIGNAIFGAYLGLSGFDWSQFQP
jgi:hypothetical protein